MKEEVKILDTKPVFNEDYVFDVNDPKWAHPLLRDTWNSSMDMGAFATLYDPDVSIEEKREAVKEYDPSRYFPPSKDKICEKYEYVVPGCPEEPDTEVTLFLYKPLKLAERKNLPVLFVCSGGGLIACTPEYIGCDDMAKKYRCAVAACKYRTSLEAPYPAAVNDLHAAYKYIIENADALGVDADNIVIQGGSSGGHLATALPFRLKRYGYSPRGVVAGNPITDDREVYPSSTICNDTFDSRKSHTAYRMWLGYNYGSGRVGPEAFANHATVEDCIGYPPLYLYTCEFDPDRDYNREFTGKVLAARSYVEYHQWGGAHHGLFLPCPDMQAAVDENVDRATRMFMKYDFRRPWVLEEYKEHLRKKYDL